MPVLERRGALAVLVGMCAALAVAHALATWPHYHVGSFDDDAAYVMVARALSHGHGLTSTLPAGVPMVASYPPGYAAMLTPIALVSGSAYAAFRGLSVGLVGVLVPLVWWYLRRRGISPVLALASLLLLALNPVLGTFAMMIMAELPFLVVLIGVLFAIERWASSPGRLWSGVGAATIVGSAALVWLKEAGAGLVIGFVLWLLLRRDRRRAVALGVGSFALFLPVLIARLVAGVDLLGSRYANEFGFAFRGGAVHVVLHSLSTYFNLALPQAVAPTSVSPLPIFGWVSVALDVFGTLTAPLVIIGFVVWCRRHRDAMCMGAPVYLASTLVFPYINERRLILILPFVLVWYVLGWAAAIAWASPRVHAARPVVWAVPLLTLVILLPQFGRDYLYDLGHGSSQPRASPYTRFLTAVGTPSDLVETDYVWTMSLFTGHRTAPGAFYLARSCAPDALAAGLAHDRPALLLSAAFTNTPGPGSPCLLAYAAGLPSAVRVFRTAFDDASVFELVGPGTPHPGLADLTAPVQPAGVKVGIFQALAQGPGDPGGPYPIVTPVGGRAVVTWDWGALRRVHQVSLGQAFAPAGGVRAVAVELRGADGQWRTVASAAGAVGDGGVVPFLLERVAVAASALRVEVRTAEDVPVYLLDAHALGR